MIGGGTAEGPSVLVVDDEPGICRALCTYLSGEGYRAHSASSAEQALALLQRETPEVALVDLRLPGMDGLTLLKEIQRRCPAIEIVLITAFGGADTVIHATQEGAYAYMPKPLDLDEVGRVVRRTLERRAVAVAATGDDGAHSGVAVLCGSSPSVTELRDGIAALVADPRPTLIVGEVGSGREALAAALHAASRGRAEPFRSVHCATAEADEALEAIAEGAPGLLFLVELGELSVEQAECVIRRSAGRLRCALHREARRTSRTCPSWHETRAGR
jgi:DNA-binding NtrC family response regulator